MPQATITAARTLAPAQDNGKRARALAAHDAHRARPWTKDDLERVRQAARAVVRTHSPYHTASGELRASVSGPAFWALLGALDRTRANDPEEDDV